MLADAVMDEAALRRLGRKRHRGFRLVVVGAGEVGGACEKFHRHRRCDRLDRGFGRFPRGDICGVSSSAFLWRAAPCKRGRPLVPQPPLDSARLRGPSSAKNAFPFLARGGAAAAGGTPCLQHIVGHREARARCEAFLVVLEFVGAERLAMGLGGAGPGRRAIADGGLAGDQRRFVGFLARVIAAAIAWIMAVDSSAAQPATSSRLTW